MNTSGPSETIRKEFREINSEEMFPLSFIINDEDVQYSTNSKRAFLELILV
jgi:hypothetical protein